MLHMFTFLVIIITISSILLFLSMTLSKKNKDQEKLSPFECGFEIMFNVRSPFSMKFFIISIIFLIFDIEIIFILPMVMNMFLMEMKTWLISFTLTFIILMWGLIHEWFLGSFKWKK